MNKLVLITILALLTHVAVRDGLETVLVVVLVNMGMIVMGRALMHITKELRGYE